MYFPHYKVFVLLDSYSSILIDGLNNSIFLVAYDSELPYDESKKDAHTLSLSAFFKEKNK